MSSQFVRFQCHEVGKVLREVPIIWRDGKPYVTSLSLAASFDLCPEEDICVTSDFDDSFETDVEFFPVHVGYTHNVYGTPVPISIHLTDSDDETTPLQHSSDSKSDEEEDVVVTGERSVSKSALKSPLKRTASQASNRCSVQDSCASSFVWPIQCKLVNKVPFDVDGDVCYGFHLPEPLTKTKGGLLSLNKIDFFVTNRTWSHACSTTWNAVTKQEAIKGCPIQVRLQTCLGEKRCVNEECAHFKTHANNFVSVSSQRRGKKVSSEYLGVEVRSTPFQLP